MKLSTKYYRDDFGNIATVEHYVNVKAYNGGPCDSICFRLALHDEDLFVYHVSCHGTIPDLQAKMDNLSCGTWKLYDTKEY